MLVPFLGSLTAAGAMEKKASIILCPTARNFEDFIRRINVSLLLGFDLKGLSGTGLASQFC